MRALLSVILIFFSITAHAKLIDEGNILLAHTTYDFDTTLTVVKKQLAEKGFQIAHVQRCDNGLKKMGYEVNKYQVVFFGRLEEVREVTKKHPELSPFMPFKILIYVEDDKTAISVMNPEMLKPMVTDKALLTKLKQWKQEFITVLKKSSEGTLPKTKLTK